MRNNESCAYCGSFQFKDGRHNSYFCSRDCYTKYHSSDDNQVIERLARHKLHNDLNIYDPKLTLEQRNKIIDRMNANKFIRWLGDKSAYETTIINQS